MEQKHPIKNNNELSKFRIKIWHIFPLEHKASKDLIIWFLTSKTILIGVS